MPAFCVYNEPSVDGYRYRSVLAQESVPVPICIWRMYIIELLSEMA